MAITQDEHNELLAQIDELNEKVLTAEGHKETVEAELEVAESDIEKLQKQYDELERQAQITVDDLNSTAKALDQLV